ncbi:MBL fold metallo-hydrolase, partial [Streptomyces hydrogenans]
VVLSGHGPQTTIGQERATNPYLRQVASGLGSDPQAPRRGM